MSTPEPDPRVYFAAERTLLAWIRTGLTIMALGFVVSRFGLFMRLISLQMHQPTSAREAWLSTLLGTGLVLLGAGAIAVAVREHLRYVHTLPVKDLPVSQPGRLAARLGLAISIAGLALGAYLLLSQGAG